MRKNVKKNWRKALVSLVFTVFFINGGILFADSNTFPVTSYIIGRTGNIGNQYSHVVVTEGERWSWFRLDFFKTGNTQPVETIMLEEPSWGAGGECMFYGKVLITGRNIPFKISYGAFDIYNSTAQYNEFSIIGEKGSLWERYGFDETISIVLDSSQ